VTAGEHVWDLTVWVALDDVTPANGPLQFVVGADRSPVPWTRIPVIQSAFFTDLFEGLSKKDVIARTRNDDLIPGVDTADWLDGVDVDRLTLPDLTNVLRARFDELIASFVGFSLEPDAVITTEMSRGSFVIFSNRILHGLLPNSSDDRAMAVSCQITKSDTLVYPGRLTGSFIDGWGMDVSKHESVLVAGNAIEHRNVWRRKFV
jgi:non-heme Fe2+,alpha-ketoglutarate-dependent halogenase